MAITDSQKRRLGIVAKAVGGSIDGEKISDMLKQHIEEGPFDETVTVTAQVRGTKSADTTAERYYGVPIDMLFNLALGMMPGFTKDHMLRLRAVATEVTKAEKEGRPIADIEYENAAGETIQLTARDVERFVELATERQSELEAEGELLSQIAKETRTMYGRVNTSFIAVKVRKGGDDSGMTVIKQTKADAKENGEAA